MTTREQYIRWRYYAAINKKPWIEHNMIGSNGTPFDPYLDADYGIDVRTRTRMHNAIVETDQLIHRCAPWLLKL